MFAIIDRSTNQWAYAVVSSRVNTPPLYRTRKTAIHRLRYFKRMFPDIDYEIVEVELVEKKSNLPMENQDGKDT